MEAAGPERAVGALGVDVTDAVAWAVRLARCPALARTAFTPLELRESGGDPRRLAVVWAVKEAVVKALGTGFAGIGWRGVEVRCPAARPRAVRVTGVLPAQCPTALRLAVRVGPPVEGRLPVLAAAVLGAAVPPRMAVRIDRVAGLDDGPRPGRAARASAAARRTAEAAARTLLPGTGWIWERTPQGAPLLRTAAGDRMSVALSHGGGLVAAVVAVADGERCHPAVPGTPHTGQRSLVLTIMDDDYLFEGVSACG